MWLRPASLPDWQLELDMLSWLLQHIQVPDFCWFLIIFWNASAWEYLVTSKFHPLPWMLQWWVYDTFWFWQVTRMCTVSLRQTRIKPYVKLHLTRKRSLSCLHVQSADKALLNWFTEASSQCFCIRLYFGWHVDTGNRDQLLRACDVFFFFLSSSLVTISCKENHNVTKTMWPEEGSSRRKWVLACLLLCQQCVSVARFFTDSAVGLALALMEKAFESSRRPSCQPNDINSVYCNLQMILLFKNLKMLHRGS